MYLGVPIGGNHKRVNLLKGMLDKIIKNCLGGEKKLCPWPIESR